MVAVISHLQFDMIAHSLNNRREKTLSGRNLLKQYLPFDVAAFVDKVIDSEGADKPRSDISSLKVVGTTALDDVKVTQVASSSYVPTYNDPTTDKPITVAKTGSAGSVDVTLAWLDKNNVPADATDAADGSGMKVADKYALGLDPNNGSKFEMSDMTMAKDGNTVTATITVPACTPPSGTVKIQTSADKSNWKDGASLASGATSANVTLEDGNVTYFRMVLDKSSN